MHLADSFHFRPVNSGLRNLYALSSERFWFALATIAGLVLAGELVELFMIMNLPEVQMLGM